MKSKEIKIEIGRLGFRAKTWAVLFIATLQGANFLCSCIYLKAGSDLEATGLAGWLVLTTLGAIAGSVSESRRKPVKNAYSIRIRTGDGDHIAELENRFERLDEVQRVADDHGLGEYVR